MTIKIRRMFALLLAVFLALSLFPGAAFAAENETSTEPSTTELEESPTEPEETPTDPPLEERPIEEIWAELEAALPEAYYDESNPDDPYPRGIPQDNFFPKEFYMDPASFPSLFTTESDFPAEMWDNDVLDSLQYIGYDVAYLKRINRLYDYNYIGSRLLKNAPESLSNVGYSSSVWVNGDGTVEDSSTVTGYAPNVERFEKYGLCCASFVAYYYCNYLPNIAGVDTTVIYDAVKESGKDIVNNRYDLTSVSTWLYALNNLASAEGGCVTRYTDADTAYENLCAGDIIIFKAVEGTGLVHVAIYLGEAPMHNGSTNYGTYHYIAHVGNSNGPEINVAEYMKSGGSKASTPYYWYHIELENQEQMGTIEVYKKDSNGAVLAGAQFLITNTVTGAYFNLGPTDENGYATTGEATIPYGTYTVKETVFPAGYQASGTGEWTATVDDTTPTVTINAVNELILGKAKIVKETTNGGTKAGWHFEVKAANGTVIGNYATDDSGEIVLDLVPGTYTVTETDGAYKYWVNDPNPTDDVHVLMIGASGVGKTAYFLYPNLEYACASGMSFLALDTKGDLARNYVAIARDIYGYRISVVDLREPTKSDGNNLLTLINRYMDHHMDDPDDIGAKAKAEKYAKILAKTIVNPEGSGNDRGQNAYFYDAAEGLLAAVVLLLAEFLSPEETGGIEVRHISSVFKLVQELLEDSGGHGRKQFHNLMDMLPPDHKAKWLAGSALTATGQSLSSVMSTVLSRLNAFLDSELEQVICFDGGIDAELFASEKSAIFLILPEEDTTKNFVASLMIQNLARELFYVANEYGGKLPNRAVFFCDELGTMPPFDILPLFAAGRSRRLTLVPIIQSLAQLKKNYGEEGAEILQDNCQVTLFGGFAPNSKTAEKLSLNLGNRTVLSGQVSHSTENSSEMLQMMQRPLMTVDELKSMSRGSFVVMKTGSYPMRTRLKLFFEWGIRFDKPLTVEENALRPVNYASKAELEEAILKKYPNVKTETPAPEMTPLEAQLQEQKKPDGLITKSNK